MYKFFFIIHACAEKRKRKRSLGCARDDETGKGCLAFLFIPRREPTSAPSGHLLPGEGGSMPPSRIVISSESEKSFSFAVKNRGEERDHGKHRTPCSAGCRYVKGLSRIPFHPAAGANLRPFGAPPSGGRREYAAFPPPPPFFPFKYPHRMAAGAGCIFGVFGMV